MKTYTVYVPCTLSICFEIEAENHEDAINKALESDLTVRVLDEHRNDINVEEFEVLLNEIQAEES
jgi:hypothetical protein